jgi:hypothetical protein
MCIARPIPGYKGLVETCRQRADELAISRLELDRLAGLPSGCSSKLLALQLPICFEVRALSGSLVSSTPE